MVSGDHIETCKHIALQAGIIDKLEAENEEVVMTGETFR